MCSIIAANKQKELDLVFLENRDRPKELFIGNDIRRIGNVVGIYDYRAQGIACGYSVKSGTAAGVANILGYTGKKSRGVLLLSALQDGRSAEDARRIIESEASSGEYSSAIYVLCDEKSIINIESFGTRLHVTRNSRKKFVVTTNHFHNLDVGKKADNSIFREKYLERLGKITEERVLKFAIRHRNPAICRHGRTLASFAVFKKHGENARILYSVEEPCKGYKEFTGCSKVMPR
ncbi:MAG: C45 family peptidase [Nitrososphaerales archaeon]